MYLVGGSANGTVLMGGKVAVTTKITYAFTVTNVMCTRPCITVLPVILTASIRDGAPP